MHDFTIVRTKEELHANFYNFADSCTVRMHFYPHNELYLCSGLINISYYFHIFVYPLDIYGTSIKLQPLCGLFACTAYYLLLWLLSYYPFIYRPCIHANSFMQRVMRMEFCLANNG